MRLGLDVRTALCFHATVVLLLVGCSRDESQPTPSLTLSPTESKLALTGSPLSSLASRVSEETRDLQSELQAGELMRVARAVDRLAFERWLYQLRLHCMAIEADGVTGDRVEALQRRLDVDLGAWLSEAEYARTEFLRENLRVLVAELHGLLRRGVYLPLVSRVAVRDVGLGLEPSEDGVLGQWSFGWQGRPVVFQRVEDSRAPGFVQRVFSGGVIINGFRGRPARDLEELDLVLQDWVEAQTWLILPKVDLSGLQKTEIFLDHGILRSLPRDMMAKGNRFRVYASKTYQAGSPSSAEDWVEMSLSPLPADAAQLTASKLIGWESLFLEEVGQNEDQRAELKQKVTFALSYSDRGKRAREWVVQGLRVRALAAGEPSLVTEADR